jgi:ParB-like chromosome segregation protein Spo0J
VAINEEKIYSQPVVGVEISLLKLTDSPRLAGESDEHVELLAAAQDQFPPIIVHRETMRVIDGAHRVKAAMRNGETKVPVRFFDGDEAEAFVLAVKLNVAHGLPLTLADRKRAAERIVTSYPEWSDRRVASVAGISPSTVADIRKRAVDRPERAGSRIGQDGRVRPLDGSAGRKLAEKLITENPHLSLRQVARAASISPETVRDVRKRLRNGEALIPGQRDKAAVLGVGTSTERRQPHTGTLAVARPSGQGQQPVLDRAMIVNRLKADPALRYTDTGRNLLRLLTLHTLWTEEWEGIVNNIPPHCVGVLADLARQFADLWTDLATRVSRDMARAG